MKKKQKPRAYRLLCLALAFLLGGCAAGGDGADSRDIPDVPGTPDAVSEKSAVATNLTAVSTPEAAAGSMADAAAVSGFAARLFAEAMALDAENPAISPVSAYLALAMAAEGAAADTLQEFKDALGVSGPALSALTAGLTEALLKTAGSTELAIANSAWIDTADALVVESGWLDSIRAMMDAEVYSADLSADEAVAAINGWVAAETNGLIPALRNEPYGDETMLVLLNALYLKAKWETPFDAGRTFENAFTKTDGAVVPVDYMGEWSCYRSYISLDGVRGAILPYDDGKTAFLALLPEEGTDVREFAATLTAERLGAYRAAAKPDTFMNLTLPKFTVEAEFPMNDALKSMGLVKAFDPMQADFSPMGHAGDDPLYIGNVLQKVKLIVDEEGAEAAAVTSVEMPTRCAMPSDPPEELHFDRPFAYAVLDLESGVPLFLGVLENPEA